MKLRAALSVSVLGCLLVACSSGGSETGSTTGAASSSTAGTTGTGGTIGSGGGTANAG